jgi:hypothetical protein
MATGGRTIDRVGAAGDGDALAAGRALRFAGERAPCANTAFRERRRVVGEWLYEGAGVGASCWQRRPQIAFRGLLVGRSLVALSVFGLDGNGKTTYNC